MYAANVYENHTIKINQYYDVHIVQWAHHKVCSVHSSCIDLYLCLDQLLMGRNESTPLLLRPGMIASNMAAPAALRFTFPSFNALHTKEFAVKREGRNLQWGGCLGGYWGASPSAQKFCIFFGKNNLILGLFW